MHGDKKIFKTTVDLSPVELIWLHSQHTFQKIEENTILTNNEIKFYKNNSGVEIRFQRNLEQPNKDVMNKAKQELSKVIADNEIRLMPTSLHKDIYVRISREARREFPKTYIIFLHYETFENCCRKLKDKFGITSITPEFERLQRDNPFFCFLIAEKYKIEEVEKYTMRILNSEVSCASTTFSNGNRSNEPMNIYKRTMSVSSLKGSFTSYDQHNQIQHCRISINNSEAEEEMFEVSQVNLVNLSHDQLEDVLKRKTYIGCRVHVESLQGSYLNMKKKLYYANRLQLNSSPNVQPIYAYSMVEKNMNRWKLSFITDRSYTRLTDLIGTVDLHSAKAKVTVLVKIARALIQLHRSRESYGDVRQENILFDAQHNLYLSSIIDKNIPPHANPVSHDIQDYLLLVYRLLTEVEITSECLISKFEKQRYFCTLSDRCKNSFLSQFLTAADKLFIEETTFEEYLQEAQGLLTG